LNLTPTEFKVLNTLASYPGKVFTREELIEKAWVTSSRDMREALTPISKTSGRR